MYKLYVGNKSKIVTDEELDAIVLTVAMSNNGKSFFSSFDDKVNYLCDNGIKLKYLKNNWYNKLYKWVTELL